MKKNIILLSIITICLIVNFNTPTYAATLKPSMSIKLDTHYKTMYKTKSFTLKNYVLPANSTDRVKWSSSNNKVVSVNQKGQIKAKEIGTAKITVQTSSGKKDYCKVKVVNICAKSISLNKSSLLIDKNKAYTFKATTSPARITETITWYSSNPNVATVKNGRINTKNYGSTKVTVKTASGKRYTCNIKVIDSKFKRYNNKKLSIMGDSISTFEGYIPKEYTTWYPRGTVDTVNKTWWNKVIRATGMTLLSNSSWSGSRVSGNQTDISTASAGCSDNRIKALSKNGKAPDIIICYLGINDFNRNVKLTPFSSTQNYIVDNTVIGNFTYAYSIMLDKIHKAYPKAEIYCCTLIPIRKRVNALGYEVENYNEVIKAVASTYEATVIDLYKCGITPPNSDIYTLDGTHPNPLGMDLIRNAVLSKLK